MTFQKKMKNRYCTNAKFAEKTFTSIVFCFCYALGMADAARATGLTQKTIRKFYLALRERLNKPIFNRWHKEAFLPITLIEETGILTRAIINAEMANCYARKNCYRNFKLGNRKARQCRDCPMSDLDVWGESANTALNLIDMVHDFYDRLGIRGEKPRFRASMFPIRLKHMSIIMTALQNTEKEDLLSTEPKEGDFLTTAKLYQTLLVDLENDPL